MRSYPSCWNRTLTSLGYRRVASKRREARRQQGYRRTIRGRRARLESLEARQMLSGTPADSFDPNEDPLVEVAGGVGEGLRQPVEIFVLAETGARSVFEVETIRNKFGAPQARLKYVGDPPPEHAGLVRHTLHLELQRDGEAIARLTVDVRLLNETVITDFKDHRVSEARTKTNALTAAEADDELSKFQLDGTFDDEVGGGRGPEAEQDDASRRVAELANAWASDTLSITASADKLKLYDGVAGAAGRATTPSSLPGTAADDFGRTTLLLAEQIKADLANEDPLIAAAAGRARDELIAVAPLGDAIWNGLGVNSRVKQFTREDSPAIHYSALYESGELRISDQLTIDLGQAAAVDVAVENLLDPYVPPAKAGVVAGTPETVVASADNTAGYQPYTTQAYAGVTGDQKTQAALFRFDVSNFSQYVDTATAKLRITNSSAKDFYNSANIVPTLPGANYQWNATGTIAWPGPDHDPNRPIHKTAATGGEATWTKDSDNSYDELELDVTEYVKETKRRGDANFDLQRVTVNHSTSDAREIVLDDLVAFELAIRDRSSYDNLYGIYGEDQADADDRLDINGDNAVNTSDLNDFLAVHGYLPGDADFDKQVTGEDLEAVIRLAPQLNGVSYTAGDFNLDGQIDLADLQIHTDNFNLPSINPAADDLSFKISAISTADPGEDLSTKYFAIDHPTTAHHPVLEVEQSLDVQLKRFDVDEYGQLRVTYNIVNHGVQDLQVEIRDNGTLIETVDVPDELEAALQAPGLGHQFSFSPEFLADQVKDLDVGSSVDLSATLVISTSQTPGEEDSDSNNDEAEFANNTEWTLEGTLDANGDGRDDWLLHDNAGEVLYVLQGLGGQFELHAWASLPSGGGWSEFSPGDFNGDGRDDVLFKDSSHHWQIAVSDGTTFSSVDLVGVVSDLGVDVPSFDQTAYAGDFDADGREELAGWDGQSWQVIQFDEASGQGALEVWDPEVGAASSPGSFAPDKFGPQRHFAVADVNRDGRDDLVGQRLSSTVPAFYTTLLSREIDGVNQFVHDNDGDNAVDSWEPWIDAATGDSTQLYQAALEKFSWIYNNVEVELYPGFMKGIEATRETKAGNAFDQSALMVDELAKLGIEAKIAIGQIQTTHAEVAGWIGMSPEMTATQVRDVLRESIDPGAVKQGASDLIFVHAWVRALVPTDSGLNWINLDPSWQRIEQRTGIALDNGELLDFNEYAFLANNPVASEPDADHRTPVEFYEDELEVALYQDETLPAGKSLADIGHRGTGVFEHFSAFPSYQAYAAGDEYVSEGVRIYGSPADEFENLQEILDDGNLSALYTHRVEIGVELESATPAVSELVTDVLTSGPEPTLAPWVNADPVPEETLNFSNGDIDRYFTASALDFSSSQVASYTTSIPFTTLDNSSVNAIDVAGQTIRLTATSSDNIVAKAISLPIPYFNPNSTDKPVLRFDFKSDETERGLFHGIGWSEGTTYNPNLEKSGLFRLRVKPNSHVNSTVANHLIERFLPPPNDAYRLYEEDTTAGVRHYQIPLQYFYQRDYPSISNANAAHLVFITEHDPYGAAEAVSEFSNIRIEVPDGGSSSASTSGNVTTATLSGDAHRIVQIPLDIRTFNENSTLDFTYDSSDGANGVHAIGWDFDPFKGSTASSPSKIFWLHGDESRRQAEWPDAVVHQVSTGGGPQAVSIPIGQGLPAGMLYGAINLVLIGDHGLSGSSSTFSDFRLGSGPTATGDAAIVDSANGDYLELEDEAYKTLPASHLIKESTVLEFDFWGEQAEQGDHHFIGWDVNGDAFDSSDERIYQIFGTEPHASTSPLYEYNGEASWQTSMVIPIGADSHAVGKTISNIVFGQSKGPAYTRSYFRNVKIRDVPVLAPGTVGEHWSTELSVPGHSLSTLQVTFSPSVSQVGSPEVIAAPDADMFYPRMVIDGVVDDDARAAAGEYFRSVDEVDLKVSHHLPTRFYAPGSAVIKNQQVRPGEIVAIGLDANQHSRASLAELQSDLLDAVSDNSAEADYVQDIGALVSYAAAKYWYDFDVANAQVAALFHTIDVQRWVGSGIAKAAPGLLIQDDGSFEIDYLPYGFAPQQFGVDLPNAAVRFLASSGVAKVDEARELGLFNASALEHQVIEEIISSESISTIKGLQRAARRTLGLAADGAAFYADHVLVYESEMSGSTRDIRYLGEWHYDAMSAPNQNSSRTKQQVIDDLSEHALGEGGPNSVAQAVADRLADASSAAGKVTVLVPKAKSQVGHWVGSVYYISDALGVELAIAREDRPPISGGAASDLVSALPAALPSARSRNLGYVGDPVNHANGNMFVDETDIVFPNMGAPLTFARHYNSRASENVGLGVGWTFTFGDLLYKEQEGNQDYVVWLTSNGERHRFEALPNNEFETPNTLHGEFSYESGAGEYHYKDKSGMEYHFEAPTNPLTIGGLDVAGRLKRQIDLNDNGVEVAYVAGTNLSQVSEVRDVTNANRNLAFQYHPGTDRIQQIVKHADGNQGAWDFQYTSIFHPDVSSSTYSYALRYVSAPPVAVFDAHVDNDGKDADGVAEPTLHYSYYAEETTEDGPRPGLMQRIEEGYWWNDGQGNVGFESAGPWHEYEYYANGRAFRVTQGESGQPNGDVQTFNYNQFRNLTEFTDENGNTETYIHQDNGLLLKQILPDRTRVKYAWGEVETEQEFLMTESVDAVGGTEKFTYYTTGIYEGMGLLAESIDKDGVATTYYYEAPPNNSHIRNLRAVTVDPLGPHERKTTLDYDPDGRQVEAIDPEDNVTTYEYWNDTHLLKAETRRPASSVGTASLGWQVLDDSFDVSGDALTVRLSHAQTDPSNKWLIADAVRIERIDPTTGGALYVDVIDDAELDTPRFNTNAELYRSDDLSFGGDITWLEIDVNRTAEWKFTDLDPGDYRVSATWIQNGYTNPSIPAVYEIVDEAQGATVVYTVDQAVASTGNTAFRTEFEYDAAGNVENLETEGTTDAALSYHHAGGVSSSTDARGVTVNSVYNALGWMVASGYGDGAAPLPEFESTFKYDSLGRLRESTDPHGNQTQLHYDRHGNVILQVNPDGTQVSSTYDGVGNRRSVTDELGRTTRFEYDHRNRLIATFHPDGAVDRLRYDGVGRVAASVDALDNVTTFTYDSAGRLLTTTETLKEENGSETPITTTNVYNAIGDLEEMLDANGNSTLFKYDKLGRVIETRVLKAGLGGSGYLDSTVANDFEVISRTEYDVNGNVSRLIVYDVKGLATSMTPLPDSLDPDQVDQSYLAHMQITRYAYDAHDRLVDTTYADGSATHTAYDGDGRVVSAFDELGRATSFGFDAYGRLIAQALPDPDGAGAEYSASFTIYSYDDADNLVQVTDPNLNATKFQYDAFNRQTNMIDALGGRTQTQYDVAGQVVAAVDALGRAVYTRFDDRGRPTLQRLPDPDGDGPLSAPTSTTEYDEVGNVKKSTDALGNATEFTYDTLHRLRSEAATQVYTVDQNDPGFEIAHPANPDVVEIASGYLGNAIRVKNPVNGANAHGDWNFENLPDGDYRILATWDQNSTGDVITSVVTVNGTIQATPQNFANQQTEWPDDVYIQELGEVRGWEIVPGPGNDDDVPYSIQDDPYDNLVGSTLTLKLRSNSGFELIADAVRLERIVSREYAYDNNGNLISEKDRRKNETFYAYDALNRLTTATLPDPVADGLGNDPPSPVTITTYDGYGNVDTITEQNGAAAADDVTTKFEYDARNRLKKEALDFEGDDETSTEFDYDLAGNQILVTEAAGTADARQTWRVFDDQNRLTWEIVNYALFGDPDEQSKIENRYDAAGNVVRVEYDSHQGNNARQLATDFEYDALYRVVAQTDSGIYQSAFDSRTTQFRYDAVGNATAVIDPLGRVTFSEFDRLDRLTRTIEPDSDLSDIAANNVVTQFEYDAVGQLVRQTNGENEVEEFYYDSFGNLVRSVDGEGHATYRSYDAEGNLAVLVDPVGNRTFFEYDNLGRTTRETIYDDQGARQTRSFRYNDRGQLDRTIDRDDRRIDYAYDNLDRVKLESWYANDQAQSPTDQIVTEYDELGRVTKAVFEQFGAYKSVDVYQYDGLDRLTYWANYDGSDQTSDVPRVVQTYDYNVDVNVDALVVTREQQVVDDLLQVDVVAVTDRRFDQFNQLRWMVDTYGGQLATVEFVETITAFVYASDGRLTNTDRIWRPEVGSYSDNVDAFYDYDDSGRLSLLSNQVDGLFLVSNWYQYDNANRIDYLLTAPGWDYGHLFPTPPATTRSYDETGQLEQAGAETFSYDANGNRVGVTTAANNRLANDGTYTYEYYDEGNLKSRKASDNSHTDYVWDHRNRLVSATYYSNLTTAESRVTYRYDATDQLVYREFEDNLSGAPTTSSESYVHDGGRRALTFNDAEELVRRHQWGVLGDPLFDQQINASTGQQDALHLPVVDHQNSVVAVLAEDLTVFETIGYDAFGGINEIRDSTGTAQVIGNEPDLTALDTVFTHHGSLFDSDTALQLKRLRWYDPDTARFVSEDPIAADVNSYRFAGNDPVNFADPSGLAPEGNPVAALFGASSGGVVSPPPLVSSAFSGFGNLVTSVGSAVNNVYASVVDTFQPLTTRLNQAAPLFQQAGTFAAQRAQLQAELVEARASRDSRYLSFSPGAILDNRRIDALTTRVQEVGARRLAALDNAAAILRGEAARFTAQGEQLGSVLGDFGRGLGTGGKAIGNSAANAVSLGFYEGPFGVTQFDIDAGYGAARFVAGVSSELLVGLATAGAAKYGRFGQAALALDVAGNGVAVGRGAVDVYQQGGLTFDNTLQLAAGSAGFTGNLAGLGRVAPGGNRVVSQSTDSFSAVTGRATPIPLHDATAPWYRYVTPRYEGKISVVTAGRTPKEIARTYSHELQHVSDFVNHPQITQLAARKSYFPGTGLARYALEVRGYHAGGSLASPLTPLKSFSNAQKAYLGADVTIFGVGGSAAAYSVYDTYFDGD